jgi:hypothetical protein
MILVECHGSLLITYGLLPNAPCSGENIPLSCTQFPIIQRYLQLDI